MGIAHRIAELFQAKVNALLDRAGDPSEMLGEARLAEETLLPETWFEAFQYRKEGRSAREGLC
jgi:hypothetical protein